MITFRRLHATVLVLLFLPVMHQTALSQPRTKHYVYFDLDRERIHEVPFFENDLFIGAQIKYTWKSLEPEKDQYDFSEIEEDLAFLSGKGKKLFIQLQDVTFNPKRKNIPTYLTTDPEYNGGANLQYEFADANDSDAEEEGWVARRWDPAVAERLHKLLKALAARFDGRIAGINLAETAIEFGRTGKYFPPGFTPEKYRDAIKENMTVMREAFKKSTVIMYANFMPGEALPRVDKGYLASLYEHAKAINAGVGGPDVIPYRPGQMNHSYRFARQYRGHVTLGYAVQFGNYSSKNEKTGKQMTIADIYDFAVNYLQVDYLFWFPEEPYFTRDVVPFLKQHLPRQ